MKYQVGFIYTYEGEYSVEADSIEEAKELLRDLVFSDPFNEPDLDGNFTCKITEVYEWDENAQKKFETALNERLSKYDLEISK
jgi:hypothetical protein